MAGGTGSDARSSCVSSGNPKVAPSWHQGGVCQTWRVRVLTIANHVGARGGLERTQLTMCKSLAGRGHQVDLMFVTAGDFIEEWCSFAHTMTEFVGSLPKSSSPLSSSIEFLRAVNRTRQIHPDVIYIFRPLDIPFAVAVGKLSGAPVVLHLCLPQPKRLPSLVRHALPQVATTVAVSHDTANLWRDSGLRTDRTIVVHTGIDMDYYVPASSDEISATRTSLGIDPDALVVLYAGRISRVKGVELLVRAFHKVVVEQPDARLVVVGGASLGAGPGDGEDYADELRRLSVPLDVMWLDARKNVLPLIQMADVAVAPSVWAEPFSRSVIEPLACGVPVIASRVGGNPEIATGWLDEYLVPPGDVDALAERIRSLCGWRSSDPGLGERCRASVVERLSLHREVDAVEAALVSAAGSGASATGGPAKGV